MRLVRPCDIGGLGRLVAIEGDVATVWRHRRAGVRTGSDERRRAPALRVERDVRAGGIARELRRGDRIGRAHELAIRREATSDRFANDRSAGAIGGMRLRVVARVQHEIRRSRKPRDRIAEERVEVRRAVAAHAPVPDGRNAWFRALGRRVREREFAAVGVPNRRAGMRVARQNDRDARAVVNAEEREGAEGWGAARSVRRGIDAEAGKREHRAVEFANGWKPERRREQNRVARGGDERFRERGCGKYRSDRCRWKPVAVVARHARRGACERRGHDGDDGKSGVCRDAHC